MKMRNIINTMAIATAAILVTGCAKNEINPMAFQTKIKDKIEIPEACKAEYSSVLPTVAVMEFTNNSTFGSAQTETTTANKQTRAAAGIIASRNAAAIGMASKSKSKKTKTKRNVNAKLAESVTPLLEAKVLETGGAKLFTRSDMKKIDAELKFQDSGLLDPKTSVKFGKLSGVKYIITGSIDNVEQTYRNNTEAAGVAQRAAGQSDNAALKLFTTLAKVVTSVTDGMIIKTTSTIRILDVETGKILFSKTVTDDSNIGKVPEPSFDMVVGGIKSGLMKSLTQLDSDFSKYFSVQGYITKLRTNGSDMIAQVNIGNDYKVEENQIFKVFAFEENIDPMSGKSTCDRIELPTKLTASQQIGANHSWLTIDDKNSNLKLLQVVQKTNEKGNAFGL